MVRALAAAGVKVAVLNIDVKAAETVAGDIRAAKGEALAIQVDVLDRQVLERSAERVLQTFGGATILINGAGGINSKAPSESG